MTTEIKNLFIKDINRAIKGVIKADDNEEKNLKNEIEEYVVTNDIAKKLSLFIEAYNEYDGAQGNGVWISGFFGSGKSHLLKMLAVILQAQTVCGYSSMDLFLNRIDKDEILKANLKKAVSQYKTENILFNIDQKASSITKDSSDALLGAFLRVFDEHCGYFGKLPYVARFERDLDEDNQFEAFKQAYKEVSNGKEWEKEREKIIFIEPQVSKALAKVKGGTPEDFKGVLTKYKDDFNLSVGDFCELVGSYLKKKGKDFRLNFFVDEIGQYIADNVKLMLNLQTISETLSTKCGSQAWIVVTAQEDMDTVMGSESGQQSNDFSKIQDRFKIRIKLTSQDVAEVIQKRLLDKKLDCKGELQSLYDKEKNNFKTLFDFVDQSREYKNYKDDDNFINSYPFVSYQFDLFQECIRALSAKNAFEGKHSSVGERSMLGVFQEVLQKVKNQPVGSIASFDLFYEGIRNQLKTENQNLILTAEKNLINDFATKILKALLLVKYVDSFKATVSNITILMQSSFDEDRSALKQKVTEALDYLERQTYIEKHGTEYSFLTDEEKDIEESINNTSVDPSEINQKIVELFFKKILKGGKIHDPDIDADLPYSNILDCNVEGRAYELGINLISPMSSEREPVKLGSLRSNEKELVIVMPQDDDKFISELYKYCRTSKFVRLNSSASTSTPMQQAIIHERGIQNTNREQELLETLSELVSRATIYALGDDVTTNNIGSDAKGRIEKAFLILVNKANYKRNLIKKFSSLKVENIDSIITKTPIDSISDAERELVTYLENKKREGRQVTVEEIKNNFYKIPYGWTYDSIICLLAFLFSRKQISFSNGSNHDLQGKDLIDNLKNTRLQQSLLVKLQNKIPENKIIQLKKFITDYFSTPCTENDGKEVAITALNKFKEKLTVFQNFEAEAKNKGWSCSENIEIAIKHVENMSHCQEALNIYDNLESKVNNKPTRELLLEELEDYLDPFVSFMSNSQKKANFTDAFNLVKTQKESLNQSLIARSDIKKLSELNEMFNNLEKLCFSDEFYVAANIRNIESTKANFDKLNAEVIEEIKQTILSKIDNISESALKLAQYQKLSEENQQIVVDFINEKREMLSAFSDFIYLQNFENTIDTNFSNELYNKIFALYNKEQAEENSNSATEQPADTQNQSVITVENSNSAIAIAPTIKVVKKIGDVETSVAKKVIETEADVEEYLGYLKKSLLESIQSGLKILVK